MLKAGGPILTWSMMTTKFLPWPRWASQRINPRSGRSSEIRVRAERRWGQLYGASEKAKASGSNQHQERSRETTSPLKLDDMGVSKDQSSNLPLAPGSCDGGRLIRNLCDRRLYRSVA